MNEEMNAYKTLVAIAISFISDISTIGRFLDPLIISHFFLLINLYWAAGRGTISESNALDLAMILIPIYDY
jgi:hypothetical protein